MDLVPCQQNQTNFLQVLLNKKCKTPVMGTEDRPYSIARDAEHHSTAFSRAGKRGSPAFPNNKNECEVGQMAMAWIWTGMVVLSLAAGLWNGTLDAVSAAAFEGAGAAVELCFSMAGILCLWTGVMAVMNRCGLSAALARLFRPLLRRLMPEAARDSETLAALSANLSANLLGLGSAVWGRPGFWPGWGGADGSVRPSGPWPPGPDRCYRPGPPNQRL